MAPRTPEHTTQTTKVELPKWVDRASLQNYQLAKRIGSKDFKPYTQERVADLDPMIGDAFDYLQKGQDATAGRYAAAGSLYDKAVANPVTMGQLKDTDLDPYINPYVANVEDKALAALSDTRQQALMGNQDAAAAAGAFGSSRHGIVDAVTNAQSAKDAGLLSAQLRSDAFNNARDAALTDIQGRYASDTGNRDALMAAAGGMNTLGDSETDALMKNYQSMVQGGMMKTGQRQKELDAMRAKWDEKHGYDTDRLNLRLSALGMSPYGKTENVERTTQPASSGTDWAQAGLGVFSLLLGLSEDDTKTDKEKVGKVPGTDLDLWAYRYKKDPKTYPKVVGIMASDVAKKMPHAVTEIDGKRVVDYAAILESI